MPGWVWLLIGLVFLLGVSFVVWLVLAGHKVKRWRAEVLERGELTTAWVVDVQPPEGLMWPIALILLCPDPDVPDDDMRDLVRRVRAARKRKPKDADGAEVARLTKRQLDALGRNRLPDGFTGGREVYSFFYDVSKDNEENLPAGGLDVESFPVKLLWDERLTTLVVPPPRKQRGKPR